MEAEAVSDEPTWEAPPRAVPRLSPRIRANLVLSGWCLSVMLAYQAGRWREVSWTSEKARLQAIRNQLEDGLRVERETDQLQRENRAILDRELRRGAGALPMSLFFLSFCDAGLPKGSQFLGGCIVEGGDTGDGRIDLALAIQAAWRQGCNPGGEVQATPVTEELRDVVQRGGWCGRLLSRSECEAMDAAVMKAGAS